MGEAEKQIASLRAENLKLYDGIGQIARRAELLASAMRNPERTGGWSGAEKVACAFDRLQDFALSLTLKDHPDA